MTVNDPATHAALTEAFTAYEAALVADDVEALDGFFWASEQVVRFGVDENLYGAAAIAAYRRQSARGRWARTLHDTVVVTFGDGAGAVSTQYTADSGEVGRQSQSWIRFPEGWRIVAAHVSTRTPR